MENFSQAKKLTYFAVLTALTVVLQLFANAIPVGTASLNFTLVPIVICGMILGVWYGAALGLVSGLITTVQVAIGQGGLFSVLFSMTPVMIVLICLLKTTAAGLLGALLFKLIKNKWVGTFVSSAIVPTVNTLIFIIGMLIVSGPLSEAASFSEGQQALGFILTTLVGINYFAELALNLILAPALYRVINIVDRSLFTKTEKKDEE